jgi:hypothetical protein
MVRQPLSVKYTGLGAYSKNFIDVFSGTSNVASPAQLKSGGFGVYGERRFMMEDLVQYSAVVALPTSSFGTFVLQGDYFGSGDFNESQLGLGYARKITSSIDIGAKFNYHGVQVNGYGNASSINFEVGTIFHLTERLHTGLNVYNPLSSKLGKESEEKLASVYKVGLGYEVSDKVLVSMELVKQEDMPVSVNAGLHYNVIENIFVRAGVSTQTNNSFIGAGIKFGTFRLDVNTAYHPQLGFSPGVLLLINFKKAPQQ